MNRIYQGRVTKVEILKSGKNGKSRDDWEELKDWQTVLWQHHELFQDAVNYYSLALAALASGLASNEFASQWVEQATERAANDPKHKKPQDREKAIAEARERAHGQIRAALGWREQLRGKDKRPGVWKEAQRKAIKFSGPHSRIAKLLGLDPATTGFDACAVKALANCPASQEVQAAAFLRLLELAKDASDLSVFAVDKLPWLCDHDTKKKTDDTAKSTKRQIAQAFAKRLHAATPSEIPGIARDFSPSLFVQSAKRVTGGEAKACLTEYFAAATKEASSLAPLAEAFKREVVGALRPDQEIEVAAKRYQSEFPLAVLFKNWPSQPQVVEAFKRATQRLATGKDVSNVTEDPLRALRTDADLPAIAYFTNLVFFREPGSTERAVWFDFDLAAFIEAIKAPHRYFQDTLKREEAANRLRKQITAMEGRGHEASDADEHDEPLLGFESDARIDLLKDIVQKKLAWLAEAERDVGTAGPKEYAIRERTVRGFGEIKRRWQAAHEAGHATEKRLLEILAEEQTEHRDDFGSATLYRELAKPEFHPIWRDGGTQPWHAEDPLAAWLDYKELQAELQDKERAIRFTPAHPKCSPRFFIFPKKSEAQPKTANRRPPKPGLLSRHEPGQLSFTAGVVLRAERGLTPTVVRIHYAAPRMCRDQLRSSGDSNLYEAPWLQPMMAALGSDKSPERVNFANCRITLQPASESDIQLAFPVEVNTEKIRAGVAREAVWERQFNLHPEGDSFYNASLRWPHEKQPTKAPVPWHEQVENFRCAATDLGQRDAGAFARLLASSNDDFGRRPTRAIGMTGDKQWRVTLEWSGLFRLPGEDAQVWRAKSRKDEKNPDDSGKPFDFREEVWGERGHPARPWEADDTTELMRLLEVPTENQEFSLLPADWRKKLSFPEQNDKLLVAMRRYQSRIARLHRWCWFLKGDDKQQDAAGDEISDCDDPRLVTPELKSLTEKRDPRARTELETQLRERLKLAPDLLVRIANRILPLHGRSWHWEKHPVATEVNPLHHLTQCGPSLDSKENPLWLRGQRGLSMERIEQVEELRKRFQSLNQMLRREVGGKPPIRRDESVPDPCPDLLDKLDNLKEQRVNQTAHMILAEALGLRLAPPPADKKALCQQRDQHGVYEKILDKKEQWIGPVDFIVIEDLSRYRASQGRAPRENSRLMKWCHRAVRDKLKQLCEVFGLPVLETPAAYSSRFCSRSGVPGFRAVEVAPGFENEPPWRWIKEKKDDRNQPTAEAAHVHELIRQVAEAQNIPTRSGMPLVKPRTLFAPLAGGTVFVPVTNSSAGAEIAPALAQADINAAINLGLRAIANPRLWTIHPRLRTHREGGDTPSKTKKGKTKKEAPNTPVEAKLITREKRKFGEVGKPLAIHRPKDAKPDGTRQPNFFADLAGLESFAKELVKTNPREFSWLTKEWTSAEIEGESAVPPLLHSKSFWGTVKAAQWKRCREINIERLAAWRAKAEAADQIPM